MKSWIGIHITASQAGRYIPISLLILYSLYFIRDIYILQKPAGRQDHVSLAIYIYCADSFKNPRKFVDQCSQCSICHLIISNNNIKLKNNIL